jgi:hypothetical protein
MDPHERLGRWLPHILLVLALLLSVAGLLWLLLPLSAALVTGAALALLSQPVLAAPVHRRLATRWPGLDGELRGWVAAGVATAAPVLLVGGPLLLLLWAGLGELGVTMGALWGVSRQEPQAIEVVAQAMGERYGAAQAIYPWLPMQPAEVMVWIRETLGAPRRVAPSSPAPSVAAACSWM